MTVFPSSFRFVLFLRESLDSRPFFVLDRQSVRLSGCQSRRPVFFCPFLAPPHPRSAYSLIFRLLTLAPSFLPSFRTPCVRACVDACVVNNHEKNTLNYMHMAKTPNNQKTKNNETRRLTTHTRKPSGLRSGDRAGPVLRETEGVATPRNLRYAGQLGQRE